MDFGGKTVLVTGGTSGIGLAAARRFAGLGAAVVISGRNASRGTAAADTINASGGAARFLPSDLAAEGEARRLARAAGNVDVLVNNAGMVVFGPTHELPDAQVRQVFEMNVLAPFALAAELAPQMAARGRGAIVNVSSMAASFGMPGTSAYGASKAALEALTKCWAAEYSASGVRVNTVAPGPTLTPSTKPQGDTLYQHAETVPMKRPAQATEIAEAIVFLASEDASFITGATLAADGGRAAI